MMNMASGKVKEIGNPSPNDDEIRNSYVGSHPLGSNMMIKALRSLPQKRNLRSNTLRKRGMILTMSAFLSKQREVFIKSHHIRKEKRAFLSKQREVFIKSLHIRKEKLTLMIPA
jgi:hypothetical protein